MYRQLLLLLLLLHQFSSMMLCAGPSHLGPAQLPR
jgi:hypothetical protein